MKLCLGLALVVLSQSSPAPQKKPPRAETAVPQQRNERGPAKSETNKTMAPKLAVDDSLVLKVDDRESVGDALVELADELNGYFSVRTDDEVVFKIPSAEANKFIAFAATKGVVVEKTHNARDLGFELARLETLLASRKGVLKKYFQVMDGADFQSLVSVEREMTSLVGEIEKLEGSLRLYEHQLQFTTVRVAFQFRDRRPPLRDGSSSFTWLNTMNLADLYERFSR